MGGIMARYTGKAKNFRYDERETLTALTRVIFDIIIKNEAGKDVAIFKDKSVSAALRNKPDAVQAVKDTIALYTEDIYSIEEGNAEIMSKVVELEAYEASCDIFKIQAERTEITGSTKVAP